MPSGCVTLNIVLRARDGADWNAQHSQQGDLSSSSLSISLHTSLIFSIWISRKTVKLLAIWWQFYQFTFWSLKVYFGEDSQARCLPFHWQPLEIAHVQSHLREGDFLIAQTKWLIPRTWDCIIMEEKSGKFNSKVINPQISLFTAQLGERKHLALFTCQEYQKVQLSLSYLNRNKRTLKVIGLMQKLF